MGPINCKLDICVFDVGIKQKVLKNHHIKCRGLCKLYNCCNSCSLDHSKRKLDLQISRIPIPICYRIIENIM